MADFADKGQALEEAERQAAVNQHKNRPVERPIVIGDKSYCIGCGCDIEAERLKIQPSAARCTECQNIHEHEQIRKGRLYV